MANLCSNCGRHKPAVSGYASCVAYSKWRQPEAQDPSQGINVTEEVVDSVRIWHVQLCSPCLHAFTQKKLAELERRKREVAKGAPGNIAMGAVAFVGLPFLWAKVFEPGIRLPVEWLVLKMVFVLLWLGLGCGLLLYGLFSYPYYRWRHARLRNLVAILEQGEKHPTKLGLQALNEVAPVLLEKLERMNGKAAAAGCPLPPHTHDRSDYPQETQRRIGSRRTGGRRKILTVKQTKEEVVGSLWGEYKVACQSDSGSLQDG